MMKRLRPSPWAWGKVKRQSPWLPVGILSPSTRVAGRFIRRKSAASVEYRRR